MNSLQELDQTHGLAASPLTDLSKADVAVLTDYPFIVSKTLRSRAWSGKQSSWHPAVPKQKEQIIRVEDALRQFESGELIQVEKTNTSGSLINALGIPSTSPEVWTEQLKEIHHQHPFLVASVLGDSYQGNDLLEDWRWITNKISSTGVTTIELNLSCPNLDKAEPTCFNIDLSKQILLAISEQNLDLQVWVKLCWMPSEYVQTFILETHDLFDVLVGINTWSVKCNGDTYGISGQAIKNLSLDFLKTSCQVRDKYGLDIEVLSIGGIDSQAEQEKRLKYGATATASVTNMLDY